MTVQIRRFLFCVLIPFGFAPGCGGGQPEVKVDPELADKPFPPVKASGSNPAAPEAGFPSSDRTRGGR